MIEKLIELSIRNRFLVLFLAAALTVAGETVFLCCESCRDEALADPDATLKKAEKLTSKKK